MADRSLSVKLLSVAFDDADQYFVAFQISGRAVKQRTEVCSSTSRRPLFSRNTWTLPLEAADLTGGSIKLQTGAFSHRLGSDGKASVTLYCNASLDLRPVFAQLLSDPGRVDTNSVEVTIKQKRPNAARARRRTQASEASAGSSGAASVLPASSPTSLDTSRSGAAAAPCGTLRVRLALVSANAVPTAAAAGLQRGKSYGALVANALLAEQKPFGDEDEEDAPAVLTTRPAGKQPQPQQLVPVPPSARTAPSARP